MGFDVSNLWRLIKSAALPGDGASSTKVIYLASGGLGSVSATLMSISFCIHCFTHKTADVIFAGAVGAMWIAVFGFATNAQNKKAHIEGPSQKKEGTDDSTG